MNKALLLCARDIELSYFRGIPLKAAIRQMQYLLVPCKPYKIYKSYKGVLK